MTEEQRKAKVAEIAKMVDAVTATAPGKEFVKLLHDICGFAAADRVVGADGRVDLMATALNSERRNVYLQVRSFVPKDILREIEIPMAKEEKN